jgi:hypothetical protein
MKTINYQIGNDRFMKFVVDLPFSLYERLRELAGGAANSSQIAKFIRIAIENQLELETAEEGLVERPEQATGSNGSSGSPKGNAARLRSATAAREATAAVWDGLRSRELRLDTIKASSPKHLTSGPLWGQYNRLFPLKFAVRQLAFMQLAARGPVPLREFHAVAAERAIRIRGLLEALDARNDLPRGERLSAAFPSGIKESSPQRFQSHFLGYLQSDGTPVGALLEIGFANASAGPKPTVEASDVGIDFAKLPNPLIDGDGTAAEALGDEEAEFILNLISRALPGERNLIKSYLLWIGEGKNTPSDLLERTRLKWPDWTVKVAGSMRAGALGRMQELGLIGRERDGLRVRYTLAPRGASFAKETR